ncbi:MAG: hypothetical protein FWD05_07465 [Oscillospiraceae bacterium]|nr:hypothetical protein [Oscillospiraceae bacterium]
MKKAILLLSISLLFLLVACTSDINGEVYENDEMCETDNVYENYEVSAVYEYDETNDVEDAITQEYDEEHDISEVLDALAEFAVYYFARLQAAWDDDDGEMWGIPLHTPVIIFCWDTNATAANYPDPEGEFARLYIDEIALYVGELST